MPHYLCSKLLWQRSLLRLRKTLKRTFLLKLTWFSSMSYWSTVAKLVCKSQKDFEHLWTLHVDACKGGTGRTVVDHHVSSGLFQVGGQHCLGCHSCNIEAHWCCATATEELAQKCKNENMRTKNMHIPTSPRNCATPTCSPQVRGRNLNQQTIYSNLWSMVMKSTVHEMDSLWRL